MKGVIKAICVSEKKGVEKKPVQSARLIVNHGIENDAHAGKWHRQVSLLSYDKVEEFNARGGNVEDGDFGENLLVKGIDFKNLPVGTKFYIGDAVLKMTQIGKECHSHCAIFHRVGECIMPKEGVFAEVLKGGVIKPDDEIKVELPSADRPFSAAVITLSDKGFKGEREDLSGTLICERLSNAGYDVVEKLLLPDESHFLKKELLRLVDGRQVDLILTTGGTGLSARDITPETTLSIADKTVDGISEYLRYRSFEITDRAMLSRGVSVMRKKTLIINLPGSPKACDENLDFLLNPLQHGLKIIRGTESECARKE